MRRIIFQISFLILVVETWSQGILFEKERHDFNEIKEEAGTVEYSFEFRNMATDSISIVSVDASCGCTTPRWTSYSIAPGDSGTLVASYDPYNRPGPFNKSLSVLFGNNQKQTIYIQGFVKPRPKSIEEELPIQIGAIRFKSRSFNLGTISTREIAIKSFDIFNDGLKAVSFEEIMDRPAHLNVSLEPQVLETKQKGQVTISYDPTINPELGYNSHQIVISSSDSIQKHKKFSVFATVEEYFPEMNEEDLKTAPSLVFEKETHDFGSLKLDTAMTELLLKNVGASDLNIRSVKTNCACVEARVKHSDIKPGESTKLVVIFDPKGRRGRQYKTVTVFSNDPLGSIQVMSIKANVRP